MNIEYAKMQFKVFEMRALRAHAEIVSGAYKLRNTQVGDGSGNWRDCTDEEKLQDHVNQMNSHIKFMSEIMESITDAENDVPSI
jgi:hypothetical protein